MMTQRERDEILEAAKNAGHFDRQYEEWAKKVPASVRKIILEEKWIHTAVNVQEINSPMEFLFSQYEMYIDVHGELNDFSCASCRQHILDDWKRIEPFLKKLEYGQ